MSETAMIEPAADLPSPDLLEDVKAGLRELEEARRRGREIAGALRPEQWSWKPSRDRWSAAEVVAHITQTNRAYIARIENAIRRGKERRLFSPGPYRYGRIGEFLLREMEPPPRRRFRAPRVFVPPVSEAGPRALQDYEEMFVRLSELLREANGLDLGRVHVTSPAARFVRIGLGQAFRLVAAHARRHLWQIQRLLQEPGFPRATAGDPKSSG
ncbi:MAG TPA: DinB family protein [bacterium]|nr:DinB family protein [bacterium]